MQNEFMKIAIKEAEKAALLGEVPVGAAVFYENRLIASAHNLTETEKDPTCHAEILAIKKACRILNTQRLLGASIYVTLEPCPMCAGAIINSRLSSVYFGAYDPISGAAGGKCDLFRELSHAKNINVYGGISENECKKLLSDFFAEKR